MELKNIKNVRIIRIIFYIDLKLKLNLDEITILIMNNYVSYFIII